MEISGFFSYCHKDDTFGFLSHLEQDIRDEFRIISGSELELFFDHDSLDWGDRWRESIESSVNESPLFIPVLSPSYFLSEACMKELALYLSKSEHSEDIILPLLLADIENKSLELDSRIVSQILAFQYLDIRELRFRKRGVGPYLRTVNLIARKIFAANEKLAERASSPASGASALVSATDNSQITESQGTEIDCQSNTSVASHSQQEEELGYLEALREFNTAAYRVTIATNAVGSDIQTIGSLVEETTNEINQKRDSKSFDTKSAIAIVTRLASDLNPVAIDFKGHSQQLFNAVTQTGQCLSVIAPSWNGSAYKSSVTDLRQSIDSASESKQQIQSFIDGLEQAEKISRTLHKPLRSIEASASVCIAAIDIIIGWEQLLPQDSDI